MPRHARRSPRWQTYDYRRAGLYVVTICTTDRLAAFGEVADGKMHPSPLGEVAASEWKRTFEIRPSLLRDASVVMPNHVHLLFGIIGDDRRDTMHGVPTSGREVRRFGQHLAGSVSSVINAYKAAVTRRARRLGVWSDGPLWQGRFHDRVVRSDAEADHIRRYIADNPARWAADRFHP